MTILLIKSKPKAIAWKYVISKDKSIELLVKLITLYWSAAKGKTEMIVRKEL